MLLCYHSCDVRYSRNGTYLYCWAFVPPSLTLDWKQTEEPDLNY